MGHRRDALEGPALEVVRALRTAGHAERAAWLGEMLPESASITSDEHRPLLAERLRAVAEDASLPGGLRARAARLADVAEDLPLGMGRVGTVWIAWCGPEDGEPGGYAASWQAEGTDHDLYEDGGGFASLADALAWAARRTDAVVVRPEWDEGEYYWAGTGLDWRGLPVLSSPPER